MNRLQRFFTRILPASWAESMRADSQAWMMQCPKCGFERSIWEMGGVKWKARGNSRNFMRCTNCGERSWHRLYRKDKDRQ